ncbi:hypothetical protein PV433_18280, partial [Paenibacillus sp. GYB004]|uniref:hypothetical protein n=1 Tax=Paenibacillus sp. GYB004 TaxID=2994393 RepID=UPI002F96E57E
AIAALAVSVAACEASFPEDLLPLFVGRSRKSMFSGNIGSVIPQLIRPCDYKIQNKGSQTSGIEGKFRMQQD